MLDTLAKIMPVYNVNFTSQIKVDYTGTSAASAAILGCNAVLLCATTDCFIVFGASPTATTAGFFLPAKMPLAVEVNPALKIAAIQSSAGGSLYVTPLS